MSTKTKKFGFLAAIGSVMDVLPGTDYRSMIDSRSDAEKIGGDWASVGSYIRKEQERYDEQGSGKHARRNGVRA